MHSELGSKKPEGVSQPFKWENFKLDGNPGIHQFLGMRKLLQILGLFSLNLRAPDVSVIGVDRQNHLPTGVHNLTTWIRINQLSNVLA